MAPAMAQGVVEHGAFAMVLDVHHRMDTEGSCGLDEPRPLLGAVRFEKDVQIAMLLEVVELVGRVERQFSGNGRVTTRETRASSKRRRSICTKESQLPRGWQ